ncbi:MAG: hypothetical protein LBB61_10445 [Treponema sp.]|jgi:electron transport complex protein RnfA|nr:hypothetical protein [Treponema sp.]
MIALVSLALFASLSLNLIVQFGLGIHDLSEDGDRTTNSACPLPFFQAGVLFITVFVLWTLFFYITRPFFSILFKDVLLFPFSILFCWALEFAADRFTPHLVPRRKLFSAVTAYDGLAFTALLFTMHIASTIVEACIISLSFSLGVLFSILILNEIQKRSSIEAVPIFLRGKPLRLISMGFLSLVFTSTTALLLRVLSAA